MRFSSLILFLSIYSLMAGKISAQPSPDGKFNLIWLVKMDAPAGKKPALQAAINQKDIDKLSQPLRALAAYYSALSGSNCDREDNCGLTTALGLGKQNSAEHIGILKKWFPDDIQVKKMINQSCFVGVSGANHFCEFSILNFQNRNDTVIVNYEIQCYDQGRGSVFNGKDKAIIGENQIIFEQRAIPWNKGKL